MYLTATRQAGNNLFALLAGPSRSRSDHTHHVVLVRRSGMWPQLGHIRLKDMICAGRTYTTYGTCCSSRRTLGPRDTCTGPSGRLPAAPSPVLPQGDSRHQHLFARATKTEAKWGLDGAAWVWSTWEAPPPVQHSLGFQGRHHYTRSRGNRRHRNQNRDCAGPITPSIPSARRHRNQNRDCAGPITCRLY